MRNKLKTFIAGAFILIMFLAIQATLTSDPAANNQVSGQAPSQENKTSFGIAKEAKIKIDGEYMIFATAKQANKLLEDAATINDKYRFKELLDTGLALYLKNGTKVKIIDAAAGDLREVRILDGDNQGKSCWVNSDVLSE